MKAFRRRCSFLCLLLISPLVVTGCSLWKKKEVVAPRPLSLVKRFHGQAMMRLSAGHARRAIDLTGLQFEAAQLPGAPMAGGDQTSIVVTAIGTKLDAPYDAVQIIVTPALRPPSPEDDGVDADGFPTFASRRGISAEAIADAVQHSRYLSVELKSF